MDLSALLVIMKNYKITFKRNMCLSSVEHTSVTSTQILIKFYLSIYFAIFRKRFIEFTITKTLGVTVRNSKVSQYFVHILPLRRHTQTYLSPYPWKFRFGSYRFKKVKQIIVLVNNCLENVKQRSSALFNLWIFIKRYISNHCYILPWHCKNYYNKDVMKWTIAIKRKDKPLGD